MAGLGDPTASVLGKGKLLGLGGGTASSFSVHLPKALLPLAGGPGGGFVSWLSSREFLVLIVWVFFGG